MQRWLMLALFGLAATLANGQQQDDLALVPHPLELERTGGAMLFTPDTTIQINERPEARWAAELLADALAPGLGKRPEIVTTAGRDPRVVITATDGDTTIPGSDESYELTITPNRAELTGSPLGVLRGVQTIRQLLPADFERGQPRDTVMLPGLRIKDAPRYGWRGMLLDCCRHFMDVEFVKRYIDLLAYHKLNTLHWHLTEDQGWRIAIDRYPKLTGISAWRNKDGQRYGGFYTKAQIREVVEYARQRGINVVPEVELPGHSQAALAAYPNLGCTRGPYEVGTRWGVYEEVYCAGREETFEFLQGVLDEVLELFPSEYIHIGGDECPKRRWKECADCQQRIKDEGLADEHELQSYFVRRIEKYLNSKGRRMIGWDEILEGGLAPNATVQSWRGMSGAIKAAGAGHDVISSPTSHCYLDYAQARGPGEPLNMGYIDLQTCYSFEPTPRELPASQHHHVLGLEGNMWTEHAPQERVDYQVFPRLCALAEVGWSPAAARDWTRFSTGLTTHLQRLDTLGVTYFLPPPFCVDPEQVFSTSTRVELAGAPAGGSIVYTLDGSEPTGESQRYTAPFNLDASATLTLCGLRSDGRLTAPVQYNFLQEDPHAGVDPAVNKGLKRRTYTGSWRELPDTSKLTAADESVAENVDLGPVVPQNNVAATWEGQLQIDAPGRYTFYLTSDDGSRLSLAGRTVVDNDGLHGSRTRTGQILLQPGRHALRVEFFQAGGARGITVEYEGPNGSRRSLPADKLFH